MEKTVRYKKKERTGRHIFNANGMRYSLVPGDVVELPAEYDLGSHIDQYVILSGQPTAKEAEEIVQLTLEIVKVGRKYNVVNPDNPDKPLNDKLLTKKQANAFVDDFFKKEADIEEMDWDELLQYFEDNEIPTPAEYETEEDLREAINAYYSAS